VILRIVKRCTWRRSCPFFWQGGAAQVARVWYGATVPVANATCHIFERLPAIALPPPTGRMDRHLARRPCACSSKPPHEISDTHTNGQTPSQPRCACAPTGCGINGHRLVYSLQDARSALAGSALSDAIHAQRCADLPGLLASRVMRKHDLAASDNLLRAISRKVASL